MTIFTTNAEAMIVDNDNNARDSKFLPRKNVCIIHQKFRTVQQLIVEKELEI